jgi:PAS domain S-box-containing protein
MKSNTLSLVAMRASRFLASAVIVVSAVVLLAYARGFEFLAGNTGAMPPPLTALCVLLLAVGALVMSAPHGAARPAAQLAALAGGALAVASAGQNWLSFDDGVDGWLFGDTVGFAGRVATPTSLMLAGTALAVMLIPSRGRLGAALFTASGGLALLMVTASLAGLVLGNSTLASLGLERAPALLATVMTGVLLVATFAQRGDAGWMSVLLGPSAAGSSARGIIAWTIIAPLALAMLALAGVQAGLYTLHFAFALLAAAMCVGLTWLVLWNAARVERAQHRAESAREAMQLASNRLRLAQSATGVQMWEWSPRTREWRSLDGREHFDPSTNEYLEAGLARCLRDGKAEFEFAFGFERWALATCWREERDGEPLVVGVTVDVTERKLAALALEASETRLQLAARALPGFVYDWNCASGKILRTSGIEQVLGYQGAEISPVSRWWEDLVHPDDRPLACAARVARVAGPGHSVDNIACEYRVRHQQGNYVWVWDHCVLVRDRAGAVVRVVGNVLDITERKETLARLAASEHRFKAALLATTGIIWTHAPDGTARGEQTSWSAFTGQSSDELAGMGWTRALHPDDVQPTLDAWSYAIATGEELVHVHRVRRRDGVYRTFSVHAVPVTNERGAIVEWVGSHTDITEQREAEESSRDGLRRLELALDAASVGMWDWDLDSGRMSWTVQTHLITGISAEQFTGRAEQFFELLLPQDVDHGAAFLRDITRTDVVRQSELQIRRPDGTVRWVQNRATGIADASGRMSRIVGTIRDITRRRELESEREGLLNAERAARRELAAAAHAKDEFLATISHELRTPLNAILGWTTLLQRPKVDSATVAEGLRVIERNARAQTQLLGDLLDANQLMSGKMSLSFEPMDLNEAVQATLESLRVTIAARRIRVENRPSESPLPVMGDSGRLQQIVSNLLSNALKFTPADGVVTVTTRAEGDYVLCEVQDSGEGIAAEFLPHIFEKFRQADAGSARKFAGLGLGLAITKQLVEAHDGSISVHSAGRGKGALFTVRLPRLRSNENVEPLPLETGRTKPLAGLRILAVDDEPDSREYLQRLLAEQGAEIVSVASASEALEELNGPRPKFNLLVSDIGMPGSTGYDLIEAVRQQLKMDERRLPAVALTAFTRPQDSARALDRGFQKHLAKPVQVGRLIGAIRQLTGRNKGTTRGGAPSVNTPQARHH